MLFQIARDYVAIGNVRDLRMHEIRFWYEGLRIELREHTKPRPKPTTPTSKKKPKGR